MCQMNQRKSLSEYCICYNETKLKQNVYIWLPDCTMINRFSFIFFQYKILERNSKTQGQLTLI